MNPQKEKCERSRSKRSRYCKACLQYREMGSPAGHDYCWSCDEMYNPKRVVKSNTKAKY